MMYYWTRSASDLMPSSSIMLYLWKAKLGAEYGAWWASLPPYLVNEDAVPPKVNPYKELYWKQFGKPNKD